MRKIGRLKRSVKSNMYFSLFTLSLFTLSQTLLTSCADTAMEQYEMQEPQSLVTYDYLKDYDVLKAYSEHIGTTMDATAFLDKGMEYRIAVSNFTEIIPTATYSHARTVKTNGKMDFSTLTKVQAQASQQGMHLIGTPLIWHQQQNATFLNAQLGPNVIRPEGDDGGYCLKLTNTAAAPKVTDAQVAYTFAKTPQVEPGISYKLKFQVRGTAEGTVQVQTYSNGKGSRFTPNITVTKEWQKVELLNTMASGIKGLTSILFNVGQYVGTLYVDDIELVEWNASRKKEVGKNLNTVNTNLDDPERTAASTTIHADPNATLEDVGVSELGEGYDELATYVEKTDAEKQAIVSREMDRYLAAVMDAGRAATTDWVVVSEPLATVTDDASLFFWQRYLGDKDYAVQAFKTAAAHTSGKLYIGMGQLTDDITRCQQLIAYVQSIESLGARVDGFALSIDSKLSALNSKLSEALRLLAATGKLVRIVDLQVPIGDEVDTDEVTEEQLQQQAATLKTILNAYTMQVPAAQRGGVTLHQTLDTSKPLGLWTTSYNRKHAYAAVCDALR